MFARAAQSVHAGDSTVQAARELVQRIIPGHARQFVIEMIPADQGRDVFEIESRGERIVLRGNTGVSVASALNWYLKYCCQCQVALKGSQLQVPNPLPRVQPMIRRVSQDRWRYFLNYCCFGYSLPWYDWSQWEKLIDWMALNGVNAPLAVTGQEAVWIATAKKLGFSDSDVNEFFAGPPYLPFGWCGVLDGWGGPLPKAWPKQHADLQQKILARERALGMRPVLQGFTGHVPPATAKRFTQARLHRLRWAEWETCLLDPLDPLFNQFASTFLAEQRRLFGTDHLYAADTFIEMTPPSGDTNLLTATGRAIYEGMAKTDPDAIWVLQGWAFFIKSRFWTQPRIEAFLAQVPDDHMLVLDLFCDVTPVWSETRGFCGKPWVWCAVQSFGDRVYLGGALNRIAADLPSARLDPLGRRLSGIGFVNEGLDYNPVVFDFLFEQAWRHESVNLAEWLRDYSRRAYGSPNKDAEAAWDILRETVFSFPDHYRTRLRSGYTLAPALERASEPPYDNQQLMRAWEHLLAAAPVLGGSDLYRFDLVSLTRQVLGNFSAEIQRDTVDAWRKENQASFREASSQMVGLFRDLDVLLASRPEYLLGRWLEDAKRWGRTREERDRLEWNARRVITMWGKEPLQWLHRDYSRREWSGMLTGFYLKRWEQFYSALDAVLANGSTFDAEAFDSKSRDWERRWADQHESYPTKPRGDSLAISRALWEKYHERLRRSFGPEATSLTTGKPATCSSQQPGCPASLANDGRAKNTDRRWATDIGIDKDPWWRVDFQKLTKVGRVVVFVCFGDERFYGFLIEGSVDGEKWDVLADWRKNKEAATASGYTCTFAPVEIKYLRIREPKNSAHSVVDLVEVLAFEK